jgi:hypothetical protein
MSAAVPPHLLWRHAYCAAMIGPLPLSPLHCAQPGGHGTCWDFADNELIIKV